MALLKELKARKLRGKNYTDGVYTTIVTRSMSHKPVEAHPEYLSIKEPFLGDPSMDGLAYMLIEEARKSHRWLALTNGMVEKAISNTLQEGTLDLSTKLYESEPGNGTLDFIDVAPLKRGNILISFEKKEGCPIYVYLLGTDLNKLEKKMSSEGYIIVHETGVGTLIEPTPKFVIKMCGPKTPVG